MIDVNLPPEDSDLPADIPMEELMFDLPELIEEDDGSALIPMEMGMVERQFDDNLAEYLPLSKLTEIAETFLDLIEKDIESRKRRDEQYEEGIRRTGLGNDAPGGAKFSGASKAVHPVLAESCVDFAARTMKELFPADGPAKTESDGSLKTEEVIELKKVADCLNFQLTTEIREYRPVYEQKLTQLPLGGSQYIKFHFDKKRNRIKSEFAPIDNIILPFYAENSYDCERLTHRQFLTRLEYESRVKSGMYTDIRAIKDIDSPEVSKSEEANRKIEGKEESGYNEDGVRTIYEIYADIELSDDEMVQGELSPYLITIDLYEEKVISIYRNWEEPDQTRQKLDWIVEDIFIPWRGAYGVGLPHLIGGLSAAATGALRALLDSAHINNAPTLLKLKNAKITGQTQQVAVTQVAEIEGPVGIDDIRKFLMAVPFNAPSPVLFQLLGWLTDAAKGVVSTASEKLADATSNTPVGTTQALIEQGAIIFSSIHARLHHSQKKVFEIVLRLLRQYKPQALMDFGIDPQFVTLKNIRPVSDPQIFSEAQRFAQMQGVLQLSTSDPEVKYNKIELHRSMLNLMKVNNIDRFLPPPPLPPQPLDPAGELINFMTGKPVITVPQQDHMSHIIVHMNYLRDPLMGMNPIMVPITAQILDHLKEHLGYFFAMRMANAAQQQNMMYQQQVQQTQMRQMMLPGIQLPQPQQVPPEQAMAQASNQIVAQDMQMAQEALQVIQQVSDFVKANMPQDPAMAAIHAQAEIQKMDLQRKIDKDNMDRELKNLQTEHRNKVDSIELNLSHAEAKHKQTIDYLTMQQDDKIKNLQQYIELVKNDQDNQQKQFTELAKNEDDNRTKVLIETMKNGFASMQQNKESGEGEVDNAQTKRLEELISKATEAKNDDRLAVIMEGLKETISAARAPRKTTPMRDSEGNLIGARSELE